MEFLDTLTGVALFALAAGIVVWRFWSGFRAGYAGDVDAPSLSDVHEDDPAGEFSKIFDVELPDNVGAVVNFPNGESHWVSKNDPNYADRL